MENVPSDALLRLADAIQLPMQAIEIRELQRLWQHDDIVLICQRPKGLEDQPDLSQRIRGALGNVLDLLRETTRMRPDPFDRETAYDLLYEWPSPLVGTFIGLTEAAVPFTVRSAMSSDQVEITIRLFGSAAIHAPLVRSAAILALEGGVSLRNGAIRVPFPAIASEWRRFDGAAHEWLVEAGEVALQFLTPVIIRSGQSIRLEPEAVMRSALRRIAALAPWMGFRLIAEARHLEVAIERQDYAINIHPENWVRNSRRRPGVSKSVSAYGGQLRVTGPVSPLLPFLELAGMASVGGECASGFGVFQLSVYP